MTDVRLESVDAPTRRGGWSPAVDDRLATLESPVRALLGSSSGSLADADRVTVVPDAHYPFHPSSGMVADPAVVGAVVRELARETDAALAVAGATDDRIAFDRTADYLGYPGVLERFDADLVDTADEPHVDVALRIDGRPISLSVPERLREGAVVVVPTLRPIAEGPVAGAVRLLADHARSSADTVETAVAAVRAVDPDLAVLDATTAYGGEPIAADALAAGSPAAVDGLATHLLGRRLADDGVLEALLGSEVDLDVAGTASVADLRELIPDGELPPSTETHPAVTTAYRLYAAVGGDAVPPQLDR